MTSEVEGAGVLAAATEDDPQERDGADESSMARERAADYLIREEWTLQGSPRDEGAQDVANGGWGAGDASVEPWFTGENDLAQSEVGEHSTAPSVIGPTELVIQEALDAAPANHPGRCSILVLMTGFGRGAPEKYLIRHARLEEAVYRIDDDVMRTRVDVIMDIVRANVTPRRGWATYEVCHELWLSRVPAAIHAVDNREHGGWWLASARDAIHGELVTARGISSVLVGSAITRRFVLDNLRLLRMDEYLFVLCFELLKESPLPCGDPVPVGQELTGLAAIPQTGPGAYVSLDDDAPLLSSSSTGTGEEAVDLCTPDRPLQLFANSPREDGIRVATHEAMESALAVREVAEPEGPTAALQTRAFRNPEVEVARGNANGGGYYRVIGAPRRNDSGSTTAMVLHTGTGGTVPAGNSTPSPVLGGPNMSVALEALLLDRLRDMPGSSELVPLAQRPTHDRSPAIAKFRRWHAVKAVLHHLHVIDDAAHADGTITINGVPVIANQVLDWMGYPYNTFKNKRTLVKLFDDIVTETEDIGCESDPDLPEILKYFVDPTRPWPLPKGSGTTVGERTAATINEKDLHTRAKKVIPFLSSRGRNIRNRRP
ncbi:hypothetical protein CALCODRAFT_481516 [Calocera cornea HHB12733]|uniref:Uncharacterized protein n=1 Tax=Calocera cornea HHB12733 TaxID=1353952 RepID=A0A165HLG2_9BASI|nr:hypothetical protein CALCODRAFT_481516 [Calocera cornea HHB12733]